MSLTQNPLEGFHPAVRSWFEETLGEPTPAQREAWPAIAAGQHSLIAAPTGSGKTLAAFLACIDQLVQQGIQSGLPEGVQVLYVSPLKALSNDIEKNLQLPLNGVRDGLLQSGIADVPIRSAVRTGDTPQSERNRMRRDPPHILVTTPESLYILLTAQSGRDMLSTVQTVIVDEIHALAANKRGAHLSLSLERLEALLKDSCKPSPVRIGISATQRPIDTVASFLMGNRKQDCRIIDSGHKRERDLALAIPSSPLETVMSGEVWGEIYDQLVNLTLEHRTTLVFVNNRRYAERVAKALGELLAAKTDGAIGEEAVAAHHGSLSREHRLDAEQRLKAAELRVMVATASLELGIDIGEVELVCQLGSPSSIAAFLQRVGRSGHAVHATPKGRLFPLSRDDLVECAALLDAVQRGELDQLQVPDHPLDVMAQQIVADSACRDWGTDELFDQIRTAWPYRDLQRGDFDSVVKMLAEGYSTRRGRRGAWIYHDSINRRIRGRRGARLTAITNGGAIPDLFDYDVILEPEGLFIGTLNEDFAFESLPGDIFQLGNTSYKVLKVEMGKVRVQDAKGQPPNIPFWFGEAPGRTDMLSEAVSRLRTDLRELYRKQPEQARIWLREHIGLSEAAAAQLDDYLRASHAALGTLPNQDTVVFERFFDEAGDMHLVVHSTFGSRVNKAWGLALRKRFCRSFNFELQAAAHEDSFVLSLGAVHSFELQEVARYLQRSTVREVLTQAVFDSPLFESRWRWNATCALALQRFRGGKRVPAQLQRMAAEDLSAVVFPDHLACLENIRGDREIPNHPLVHQTISDALTEAMDIDGLEEVLENLERGEITVIAKDLTEPSPLACDILTAKPYAFLDDAPAEERRTRMVQARRHVDPVTAADFGKLDPKAIAQVCEEVWPTVRDADELHDALMVLGYVTQEEAPSLSANVNECFESLSRQGRIQVVNRTENHVLWCATERVNQFSPLEEENLREIIRGRLQGLGPVTIQRFANELQTPESSIEQALIALETEGFVMRGAFTAETAREWCERRLLARIHRYSIKDLRAQVKPVTAAQYSQFLLHWQGVPEFENPEGKGALLDVIRQLQGFEAPAAAWESEILSARLKHYDPDWLDQLCASGRVLWARLTPPKSSPSKERSNGKPGPVRQTPIALLDRTTANIWMGLRPEGLGFSSLSPAAQKLHQLLDDNGAQFFAEIQAKAGLLSSHTENALAELVACGRVACDSYLGLRALITPKKHKKRHPAFRAMTPEHPLTDAGRWYLLPSVKASTENTAEAIALMLLRRYGVVFKKILTNEVGFLPPWRDLLYVYRRMEDRGEIRGGRFVAGVSGEQFAVPEALTALKKIRNSEAEGVLTSLSASDPLNLTGGMLPGDRVQALTRNRILFRDGTVIASYVAGKAHFSLDSLNSTERWNLEQKLIRGKQIPAPYGFNAQPGPEAHH